MINEGIFLQSYGFYGGDIGSLLSQWEQMGVFSYMLPFLLIFALLYGILSKMSLFGDPSNKSINAIIALSVALMALQFGMVSVFFSEILPRLGIALAGVLVLLILMGLFGNPNNKTLMNTLMWGAFGVALVIIIQSLGVFSYYGSNIFGIIPPWVVPLLVLGAAVALVVVSAKKPDTTSPAGHFFKALGGGKE